MNVTFNHSDFQCLQDQLVDLKTKNYELAEKNRRFQADFEAAKAKICALQLKLEEQERDFELTSTTLRREIEAVSGSSSSGKDAKEEDYKVKYKKLLHKAKELQIRYEKSCESAQQLVVQNKNLSIQLKKLEEDNVRLQDDRDSMKNQLQLIESEYQEKFEKAIEEYKSLKNNEISSELSKLAELAVERDKMKCDLEKMSDELVKAKQLVTDQIEERKIHERKGLQIVKELKRQLVLEKSRTETLQQRIENLLKNPIGLPSSTDLDNTSSRHPSNSSSTNEHSSSTGTGVRVINQDNNSVGSWNLVGLKTKSSSDAPNETLSLCSMGSEDCQTVQQPCDNQSESMSLESNNIINNNTTNNTDHNGSLSSDNLQQQGDNISRQSKLTATSIDIRTNEISNLSLQDRVEVLKKSINGCPYSSALEIKETVTLEDQAALMDRLTRLQQDKWVLEEKLSYMEQANSSLSEELANKNDLIRTYFFDQAAKAAQANQFDAISLNSNNSGGHNGSKRGSLTNNVQNLLSEKPSFKKMVDFLKEKSHLPSSESEAINREAMNKMRLMLEETLIKCKNLQDNLDFVTSELNKARS